MPPSRRSSARRATARAADLASPVAPSALRTHRLSTRTVARRWRRDQEAEFRAFLRSIPHLSTVGRINGQVPRMLAEGDSWFNYPVPTSGGGVIAHLQRLARIKILNLAHYGDMAQEMLGVEQRKRLVRYLSDNTLDFTHLLFSGGGNDFVGDTFCLLLKPRENASGLDDAIIGSRADAVFHMVEASYRELIALRDEYRPNCMIVTHRYAYPIPSDQGVCGQGPWLKPSLDLMKWTDPEEQKTIAKMMIDRLDELLKTLKREQDLARKPFLLVDLPLDALKDHWENEIHPTRSGFKRVAQQFMTDLNLVV